jgi:hypothetical protein
MSPHVADEMCGDDVAGYVAATIASGDKVLRSGEQLTGFGFAQPMLSGERLQLCRRCGHREVAVKAQALLRLDGSQADIA